MVLARPRTVAEALDALAAAPDAVVLGGGTDRRHRHRRGGVLERLAPDVDERWRDRRRLRGRARARGRQAAGRTRPCRRPLEETRVFCHAPTQALDDDGQGDAHVSFVFAATRAVVDVDLELGSVNVLQIATGQDVGRALNPLSVTGQIEGGIAQGLGLALFEELRTEGGVVVNASLRDYLLPTTLDVGDVVTALVERPEPGAPFGAKGVGEIPTIPVTPAIVAAIHAATGRPLLRIPVRLADIAQGGP